MKRINNCLSVHFYKVPSNWVPQMNDDQFVEQQIHYIRYFSKLTQTTSMQKTKQLKPQLKTQKLNKKQQLQNKKQTKRTTQQSEIFQERKKKQQKKSEEQTDLSIKGFTQEDADLQTINLEEATKSLKKKAVKATETKVPPKIKVKNKFFADINIEIYGNVQGNDKYEEKNFIEEELSLSGSKKSLNTKTPELILQKHKQTTESSINLKFQSLVQKTEFIRARHQFKKLQEDTRYKAYVKKKLEQVQQVDEVTISNLEVPQIHRNKLISSSIYINHEGFKKDSHKKTQNETAKKMTAEQIIMERKMLRNRDYFYKKLGQKIKEERFLKEKQSQGQSKGEQKVEKDNSQNSQIQKLQDDSKSHNSSKISQKEINSDKTRERSLTKNLDSKRSNI